MPERESGPLSGGRPKLRDRSVDSLLAAGFDGPWTACWPQDLTLSRLRVAIHCSSAHHHRCAFGNFLAPSRSRPAASAFAAAASFLEFRQHLVEREAAGLLPGRESGVGFQMFAHQFLRWDKREEAFGAPLDVIT